jgi:hypothetical protein
MGRRKVTPALHLAALAAQELRKAELNEQWGHMADLIALLQGMGARVMRVPDTQFRYRADYLVQFRKEDALPGTF